MMPRDPYLGPQQQKPYYNPFVPPFLPPATLAPEPRPAPPNRPAQNNNPLVPPFLPPSNALPRSTPILTPRNSTVPKLGPRPAFTPPVLTPDAGPTPSVNTPLIRDPGLGATQPKPSYNPMVDPMPQQMNTQSNREFQDVMQRQSKRTPVQPIPPMPGDPPKMSRETTKEYNDRVMRHRMGYPRGTTRSAFRESTGESTGMRSPSDKPPTRPARPRDYFGEAAEELALNQLAENSSSDILRTEPPQRDFYDRTGTTPLFTPGLMLEAPTGVPVAPGVNEELLDRLPSRREQDRSTMQPGGMVSGEAFDRMRQQDAARRASHVMPKAGPRYTNDADEAKVREGDRRRRAMRRGEVYTDPVTGEVRDFAAFKESQDRQQARKDEAQRITTRASQIQAANSGRIGALRVDPSGGIAGPQHVGMQPLFGQMGRGAAIAMAVNELNREERASDALRRAERQESIRNRLKAAQAMQDGPEKDAVLKQINDDIVQPSDGSLNEYDKKYKNVDERAKQGQYRKAPARKPDTPLGEESVDSRNAMGYQVFDFLNDDTLSDQEKKDAILRQYPELETEQGIDDFVSGTRFDSSVLGRSQLSDRLRRLMGIPTEQEKEQMRQDIFGPDPTDMLGFE